MFSRNLEPQDAYSAFLPSDHYSWQRLDSEFDLWQVLGGKKFTIGSRRDFDDGYLSTWVRAGNRWILNGIACPRCAPTTWHNIQWYLEIVSPTQYRYDTLLVDGHPYNGLNIRPGQSTYTPWPDQVGVQNQPDQDSTGAPNHKWVELLESNNVVAGKIGPWSIRQDQQAFGTWEHSIGSHVTLPGTYPRFGL